VIVRAPLVERLRLTMPAGARRDSKDSRTEEEGKVFFMAAQVSAVQWTGIAVSLFENNQNAFLSGFPDS
jgi:hypothetical protein